ncbi:hypothetical protein IEQ34_007118 [Dendrobium chrysotoxum]|uniref:Uncharacterized protein n=1 Tax=Dendrobium chrysotoxum TaxID=161865 RepID=A0AAV7H7E7_DENCH|nr:hypothetical protein IEQ34_007118 [Dendrobium chrysotoxum]
MLQLLDLNPLGLKLDQFWCHRVHLAETFSLTVNLLRSVLGLFYDSIRSFFVFFLDALNEQSVSEGRSQRSKIKSWLASFGLSPAKIDQARQVVRVSPCNHQHME